MKPRIRIFPYQVSTVLTMADERVEVKTASCPWDGEPSLLPDEPPVRQWYENVQRRWKCRSLLSGFEDHGLYLKSLLHAVSPPSMCGIFRSSLSDSQMNSLPERLHIICQQPQGLGGILILHQEKRG